MTEHSEVTDVWLARALYDPARALPADSDVLRSHDNLRRYLQERGLEKNWFAVFSRHYRRDGAPSQMSYIYYPCDPFDGSGFANFKGIASAMAGKHSVKETARGSGAISFASARIRIIPEALMTHAPRETVGELEVLAESEEPAIPNADPLQTHIVNH